MKLLLRASLRQLLVQRGTTLTVFAGISLAMLSVVAVHLLSDQIQRQLDRSNGLALLGLTHVLKRAALSEDDYFALRGRWRSGEMAPVEALVPLIMGRAVATTEHGKVAVEILGFDPLTGVSPDLGHGRRSPADTRWLRGAEAWSADGRLPAGSKLKFADPRGTDPAAGLELSVAAVRGGRAGEAGDPLLMMDVGVAQRILARPGELDAIGAVRALEVPTLERFLDRLFPGLGARRYVTEEPWEVPGYVVDSVGDRGERLFAGAVLFNVSALGLLSVVVAAFLIHQAAVNSIRQREVVLDRLGAMGATNAMLARQVATEGLLVALIGAAVGATAGWWCAGWLSRSMLGGALLGGPGEHHAAWVWAVGKAMVFGPAVGSFSMWQAFWSVRGGDGTGSTGRRRGLMLLLCSVLVWLGVGWRGTGIAGAFAAIAGVTFAGALAVGPILSLWRRPRGGGRLLSLLNRRSLGYRRADVGVAVGGLVVALATACGMSLMVASFRIAFEEMLDQRLDAAFYLDSDLDLTPSDERALRAAVGANAEIRLERRDRGSLSAGARRTEVIVIHDTASTQQRYGFARKLDGNELLIGEPGANRIGLSAGDRVVLTGNRAALPMVVAGVFRDYGAATPRVVVSARTGTVLFGPVRSGAAAIDATDPRAVERLKVLAAERGWRLRANEGVRAFALDVFTRTFRVSDALVVIAIGVAGIGLLNALAAARLRRAREFRLLHAMGLSAAEQVRMNVAYAVLLGLHAAVLAVPAGLGVGWLLCDVLNPRAFGWSIPFAADWRSVALPVALGLSSALIAGLAPVLTLRRRRADAA